MKANNPFQIKNQNLIQLDKDYFNFNAEYLQFLNLLGKVPNLFGLEEIKAKLSKFKQKLNEIQPETEFDKLVLEHFAHSIFAQEFYANYFTLKGKGNIDEFAKVLYSDNSIEILKQMVRDYNYKKHWEWFLEFKDLYPKLISPEEEQVRAKINKLIFKIKTDILTYAKKNFAMPADYDFDMVLAPPYIKRSSWNPEIHRLSLSGSDFICYVENGELMINPCDAILTIFHEVVGHGMHTLNSQNMPLCLQTKVTNTSSKVALLVVEGIARYAFEQGLKFIIENKEKYKFSELDIDYAKHSVANADQGGVFALFYAYLRAKAQEQDDFDIEKEFLKVSQNYGILRNYSHINSNPCFDIMGLCYPIGSKFVLGLVDKIKDKAKDQSIMYRAISTGVWSWKVYPKFVNYFLENTE